MPRGVKIIGAVTKQSACSAMAPPHGQMLLVLGVDR